MKKAAILLFVIIFYLVTQKVNAVTSCGTGYPDCPNGQHCLNGSCANDSCGPKEYPCSKGCCTVQTCDPECGPNEHCNNKFQCVSDNDDTTVTPTPGGPTVTPKPGSCVKQTFVSGSISATTVKPYDTVTVKCNYGKNLDCISVKGAGLKNCRYSRYEGNDAYFVCDAGANAGYYSDTACVLFAGSTSKCCSTTNTIGGMTILGTDVHYDQDVVLPFGTYTLSSRVHAVIVKNQGVRIQLICNSDTCANNTKKNAVVYAQSFKAGTAYATQTNSVTLSGTGDDRHYIVRIAVDKGSEAYIDSISLKGSNGKELIANGDFSQTTATSATTIQPNAWGEGDNRIGYYYGSTAGTAGTGTEPTAAPTTSVTGSPATTITPGPASTVTLALKIKLQGVTKKPANSNAITVQVKLGGGGLSQSTAYQTMQMSVDDSGVWSGRATFNSIPTGGGYRVYIKGPKHIQKKICDSAPTESPSGAYHCGDGKITLKAGDNTLDFSNIIQLAGDLPQADGRQNGVIDSYDTTYIRQNLGSTDATKLTIGDLNLDKVIDSQDYSTVLQSLSIKYDEE